MRVFYLQKEESFLVDDKILPDLSVFCPYDLRFQRIFARIISLEVLLHEFTYTYSKTTKKEEVR